MHMFGPSFLLFVNTRRHFLIGTQLPMNGTAVQHPNSRTLPTAVLYMYNSYRLSLVYPCPTMPNYKNPEIKPNHDMLR
jgi:hypothetical protein